MFISPLFDRLFRDPIGLLTNHRRLKIKSIIVNERYSIGEFQIILAQQFFQFEEIQPSPHIFPNSPAIFIHPPSDFCINNNPMICGDMSSVGGQSSSTDESECPISFIQNV